MSTYPSTTTSGASSTSNSSVTEDDDDHDHHVHDGAQDGPAAMGQSPEFLLRELEKARAEIARLQLLVGHEQEEKESSSAPVVAHASPE